MARLTAFWGFPTALRKAPFRKFPSSPDNFAGAFPLSLLHLTLLPGFFILRSQFFSAFISFLRVFGGGFPPPFALRVVPSPPAFIPKHYFHMEVLTWKYASLAFGFLAHHAKKSPYETPFRCAIFLNSLPPFRIDQDKDFIFDEELHGLIKIPTIHIVGKQDFVYSHSLKLHQLCDPRSSALLAHDKGHEIPTDPGNVGMIANALRGLNQKIMVV